MTDSAFIRAFLQFSSSAGTMDLRALSAFTSPLNLGLLCPCCVFSHLAIRSKASIDISFNFLPHINLRDVLAQLRQLKVPDFRQTLLKQLAEHKLPTSYIYHTCEILTSTSIPDVAVLDVMPRHISRFVHYFLGIFTVVGHACWPLEVKRWP